MNARGTIILGIILAMLLGAYWYVGTIDRDTGRTIHRAKKLLDFPANEVSTLSIARPGYPHVEALRQDGGPWQIAAPYTHIPANQVVWSQLAAVVANLSNERTVEEVPEERESYGLNSPPLSVIVGTTGGELLQIAFGAIDPTQINRYAQLGDGEVFLTPAEGYQALNRSLNDLRDRRLFTILGAGLSRFDFKRYPTEEISADVTDPEIIALTTPIDETYELDDQGSWFISTPISAPARQDQLPLLARILQFAAGSSYIDDPTALADYGLDPPFAELTVYGEDDSTQSLQLGWLSDDAENPGIFAKRTDNPAVLILDARLLSLLPAEPEHFREKRLFAHKAISLNKVHFQDNRNDIVLEHNPETGWTMTKPEVPDTDRVAVSMYVANLKGIQGQTFPDPNLLPPDTRSSITLDFEYSDGSPPSAISIAGPVPDSDPLAFYAVQDIGQLTTISFDMLRAIQATPFQFRNKTLFPFSRDQVREIDLRFEDKHYVLDYEVDRWKVIQPEGGLLESQSDAEAIIDAFTKTVASGIANPVPAPEITGLQAPFLEASFELVGGPNGEMSTFGPVRVGNRKATSSNQRFLTLTGIGTVYFIDQALISDLRDALRGIHSTN